MAAPSETAETLLVRREGNEAVFLNELKFQKHTALALRMSLDSTDLPAVKAALGQEGIVEGVDYRGVPVLAAVRAVPDSPWFLVAKMDTAEVYAPMREWLWLTVLFVGVLLFGLAAAVGFLWRQRHAALYRQKYEAEHKYRDLFESSRDALMTMSLLPEVHRRQPGNAGDVPVEERCGTCDPRGLETYLPSGSRTDALPAKRPGK